MRKSKLRASLLIAKLDRLARRDAEASARGPWLPRVAELNELGIKTARDGEWSLLQLQRVMARVGHPYERNTPMVARTPNPAIAPTICLLPRESWKHSKN